MIIKRLYLASRFGRKDELSKYAAMLKELNYIITARWLDESGVEMDGLSRDEISDIAVRNVADVFAADTMVQFTDGWPSEHSGAGRGGRHVELGIAIARNMNIFLVGPRENAFHYIPTIVIFQRFDDLLSYLRPQ